MVSRSKKTKTQTDQRQAKTESKKTRSRKTSAVSAKSKSREPEEETEKRKALKKKSEKEYDYEMGPGGSREENWGKAPEEELHGTIRKKRTYPSKSRETEKKEFGGRGYDPDTYQGGEKDYRKGGSWYGTGFNEGYEVGFGNEEQKDFRSQHGTYHASAEGGEWDQDYEYRQGAPRRFHSRHRREFDQDRPGDRESQRSQEGRQGYDRGTGHVYGPEYSRENETGYNFHGDWGIGSEYHEHPYRGEFTSGQRRGYGASYQGWPEQGWPEESWYGPKPEGYERERSFYTHHRRHYYPEGYQEGISQYGQSFGGGYTPRQESEGYYEDRNRPRRESDDYRQQYGNRGRDSKKFRDQGRRNQY